MNTRPDAAAKPAACHGLPTKHTEASIDRHFQAGSGSTFYSFVDGFDSYKTTLPVFSSLGSDAWRRAFLAPSMFFYGKGPNVTCHLLVEEDPLEPLEGHVTVVLSYFSGVTPLA
jgi:hypothetical protein